MSEKQLKLKGIHGSQIVVCATPAPGIGKAIHFDNVPAAQQYLKQNFRLQAATAGGLLELYSWLGGHQSPVSISASRADTIRETIAKALVDKQLHAYEVPAVTRPEPANTLSAGSAAAARKKSSSQTASSGGQATANETSSTLNESQSSNATGGPDLPNKDKATCGDPVAMCNGEEILELTDFTLDGPLPLHWVRSYRSSQSNQAVGLGYGWRTPFHQSIERSKNDDGTSSLVLINDEGRHIHFDDIQTGSSCHQLTESLTLHHKDKGSLVLYQQDQHWEFAPLAGKPGRWVLHKVLNSLGHNLQCFYDQHGRLSRIDYTSKKGIEFYYGAHQQLERIEAVEKTSEGLKALGLTLAQYQYNEAGDMVSAINRQQQQEHYRYDGHLLVERQRASGFRHYFSWDKAGPSARCVRNWGDDGYYDYHFEYLDDKRLAISTDSRGQRWEYWHNAQNRLIKKVAPDGATWHYRWTLHGQKQSEVAPGGAETSYRYNRQGQLAAIVAADGATTRFEYNALGQRTTIVDAEGGVWQREFTAAGLLRLERRPDDSEVRYRYNEKDQLIELSQPDQSLQQFVWDEEGHLLARKEGDAVTRYSYDQLGRLNGSMNAAGLVTEYIRDAHGQLTSQKQYPKDAPEQAELQQYQYDAAGRLVKSTNVLGQTTEWRYEGLSQPVELRHADGSSLHYEYDKERNLTGIMRSDGARYQLDYDGQERPVRLQGFDGREQQFEYDADGKVSSLRDSNERFIKVKRDLRGRIIEQTAQVQQRIDSNHFHYDKVGRLLRANNAQRKLRFGYDKAGQLTDSWQGDWRLQHQYRHGKRSQTVLPDGTRLDYHYHSSGQLSQLAVNQQPVLWRNFDAAGREIHREYASGLQQHQAFNAFGQLTEQRWQGFKTEEIATSRERHYQYSSLHQLTEVQDSQEGDTRYQYNAIDQLIAKAHCQDSSQNESHQWDSFGNPVGEDIELQQDRLTRYHDHNYQYDASGNQIVVIHPQHSQRRDYNGFNQLVSLSHKDGLCRYEYDALGRRSAKITSQGRIDYLWDGDTLLGECQNGDFSWYIFEPGTHKPLFLIKHGELYSYQLNQLGTPLSVTDSNNQIVWQAHYSSFGKATVTVNELDNPIRFQGQYYDNESGLHYNHFRYYDPTSGRFISQDPIGLLGGINHYQYAPNHINWVDPLGLHAKSEDCPNSYKARKKALNDSNGAMTTLDAFSEAHATGEPWDKAAVDENWIKERQQLHKQILDTAATEALTKTQVLVGVPAIHAMRGNTGAGKSRLKKSGAIPELAHGDIPVINPDDFKPVLIKDAKQDGIDLTHNQTHWEAAMLSDKLKTELLKPENKEQAPSIIVDKRLGGLYEVENLHKEALETGRQLNVFDVDAPLEMSLLGVLLREPGGDDPIVPFDVVAGGFIAARGNREQFVQYYEKNPSLGRYELYHTLPDGNKELAAVVIDGKTSVANFDAYEELTKNPKLVVDDLTEKVINDDEIARVTSSLPDGEFKTDAINALSANKGKTWKQAIDQHGKN